MYRLIIFICLTILPTIYLAAQSNDHEQIKSLIQKAYVDGTQNLGSLAEVRMGFHPDFVMFRFVDDKLIPFTLKEWIESIEMRRKENPDSFKEKTTCKILQVDITRNAATVKLELHKGGSLIFTDYLSLYKFENDGWRIVSKTYFKH
jgi:hypothetical protein